MSNISKTTIINDFLNERPETIGVFGYGSGITKQSGYTENDKPQIDLILAVENDKEWHLENMKANPNDYSLTGKLFFSTASPDLYHYGSDVCYVTNLVHNGNTFKIGVISKDNLVDDLVNWRSFYLAGRFQKPMLNVKSDPEINDAIKVNRGNALVTALFLLGQGNYNVRDLYAKICSLSYIGDTRMGIAENPNKVMNIVNGGFEILDETYSSYDLFAQDPSTGSISYDESEIFSYLLNIPLDIPLPGNDYEYTKEELLAVKKSIEEQLKVKNRDASAAQTIKGLMSVGPIKSVGYAYHKVAKRFPARK
jgi:translocator assembly and maintenance protein 41